MSETNQTEGTAETKAEGSAEAKPARKRKSAATKSTKAKSGSGEKTKTSMARAIFKANSRGASGPNRKKIIAKFVEEVKLTTAGASTYYQKFLSEFKAEGKKESRKAS